MDHQERMIEMEKFNAVCAYLEVSEKNKEALRFLIDYQVELILDDSYAMLGVDKGRGNKTCWKEMQDLVNTIWTLLDTRRSTSFDMHFMNNGSLLGVTKREQIDGAFTKFPSVGRLNPMTEVLKKVLKKPRDASYEAGRLILICTASNPDSNTSGDELTQLKKCLEKMDKSDYVTFISCTNNEKAVSFLKDLATKNDLERIAIVKDFAREKGSCSDLTRGDYAAEALVRCLTSRRVSKSPLMTPIIKPDFPTNPFPPLQQQPQIYPNYGPYPYYYPTIQPQQSYYAPQQIYYQPPLQQNQPTYYYHPQSQYGPNTFY